MPSLGDIANEAKALLADIKSNTNVIKGHTLAIKTDTSSIKSDTSAINSKADSIINLLNQIDTDLKQGFVNLAQGLNVLISLGIQTNQLLAENNDQNRTIICWLTNSANTLCDIKRNTDKEVAIQSDLSNTLHHMDDINELVNSREAMDVANRYEIEDRMDECCPEKEVPEKPCFDKCLEPRPVKVVPVKHDWKPVEFAKKGKIG